MIRCVHCKQVLSRDFVRKNESCVCGCVVYEEVRKDV